MADESSILTSSLLRFIIFCCLQYTAYAKLYCYTSQAHPDSGHHDCILPGLKYYHVYHLCCGHRKIRGLHPEPLPNHGRPLPAGCILALNEGPGPATTCPVKRNYLRIVEGQYMCCTDPAKGTGVQAGSYLSNYGMGSQYGVNNQYGQGGYHSAYVPSLLTNQPATIQGRMMNPMAAAQLGLSANGLPLQNLPGTPTNTFGGSQSPSVFNDARFTAPLPARRCSNVQSATGDADCGFDTANRCNEGIWRTIMHDQCPAACMALGVLVPGCSIG
ncbi:hypothetical protein DdX_17221 [Ditylenchus destructor]|uniref:Uncharacterized protein n=1 Tax=Ditylenchus destructor TaxID=166010 RepID=A0AAD4QZC9_9BILA|nr:hypothetical protein DdX_17221 [Ditylenchus destructor]